MNYDPKKLDKMIRDSGVKISEIVERTGMSRQTLHDLRQPEHAQRLTLDKVLKIAHATKMKASDYFQLPTGDAQKIVGYIEEPVVAYGKDALASIQGLFENIVLSLDKYRDEYIQSLKYNISLQERVIAMQEEKLAGTSH